MSRRKRRVTTITPGRVEYADDIITLAEFRDGAEHVVRVKLDYEGHFIAFEVACAARKHVASVQGIHARRARWANEALTELGGAK